MEISSVARRSYDHRLKNSVAPLTTGREGEIDAVSTATGISGSNMSQSRVYLETTNTTVRERFKFDESKMTKVFRLLKDAIESNRIKVGEENASRKFIYYLPYWA